MHEQSVAHPDVPVTEVVVTYNSEDTIDEHLRVAHQSHAMGLLNVIVVDNASADGTVQVVRDGFPWVEVREPGANLGYGSGLNHGLREVGTEFVLFANPDALLPAESLLSLLRVMRSHPEAGMAGPAILDEHGTTNFAGGLLTARQVLLGAAGLSPWERQRTTIAENSPAFRTTWLSGALLLARTEAANRLGGFDPRFFLYFEETDLCKRMADAGYELWAVGEAVATHVGGVSVAKTGETATHSGCIARHYYESRFYYMVKHHGWAAAALAEGGELAFKAGRDVLDVVFRRGKGIRELRSRLRGPLFRMPPPSPRPIPYPSSAGPSST